MIKFKKYDLVEIWNEFAAVNIKVSMDGIEDVYNYIRQDGDWDTVYANMLVLSSEPTINLAVGITVQSHNVFHMPEFYDFWADNIVKLDFITANVLHTPKYLSPALWPANVRKPIVDKLKEALPRHPEMRKFITYMLRNKPNALNYSKMRKYTRDLEARYPKEITLKSMLKKYLKIKLEGMDIVDERLKNEKR